MSDRRQKTLILALGNPILSDDGVAWEVADRLAASLPPGSADILKESGATLDLVGKLAGYARLVVLDAIQLRRGPVGTVYHFTLDDFRSTVRWSSAHDLNFASAFELGRRLGYSIPDDVRIYAMEVNELQRFHEGCTPEVVAKLTTMADEILADMAETV